MTGLRTYARGTAANLVRGIAPALINGLLPIVLVSFLTRDSFSAWSLAMSLTAYVAVFQAGVYQAVTSVAAPKRRTLPTSTQALPLAAALEFLAPLMAAAAVVAGLLTLFASRVFPSIPSGLLGDFAAALLLLTAAAICTQLSAAGWGFALGIDRVGRAMTAWTSGRVVSVATTIALAVTTHNIALAALGFAAPIAISLPLQLTAVGLNRRDFAAALRGERRAYRVLYRRAAHALIAQSVGGLMVWGVDGLLVGHFDFAHAGVFVFSAAIVALFIGVTTAWTASYLAHAPALGKPEADRVIPRVARIATTANLLLAALAAIPMWQLLHHFFSPDLARSGYAIFVVLIIANAVRQWAMPPVLSSLARQHYARLVRTGLAEGMSNLVASVALCVWLGALGVALGTLVGAVLVIPVVVLYTFRDSMWAALGVRQFAVAALVRPTLSLAAPIGALFAIPGIVHSPWMVFGLQVLMGVASIAAAWLLCIDPAERIALRERLSRGSGRHRAVPLPRVADEPVDVVGRE